MTPQEQAAFVKAYIRHMDIINADDVAEVVQRICAGDKVDYKENVSVFDALGIWHSAIKWKLEEQLA